MTQYEILDKIADSYNPILFLAYIVFATIYFRQGDKMAAVRGFLGILFCYFVLFVDTKLKVWESLGLDFSTHSAVALALVSFHIHKRKLSSPGFIGFTLSLLAYYLLELYQEYHTIGDIISTCLVIGPAMFGIYKAWSSKPKTEWL